MVFREVIEIYTMKDNKKQLTDEEIEEIIEKKYSKKLPHTKDYIRERLREDPNYKCKFSMVKQDFIDEALKVHPEKYNYEYLPKFIYNAQKEKVRLICEEIDPYTGEIYGEFETTFNHFVLRKQNIYELGQYLRNKKKRELAGEIFLNEAKEKFPNLDFSKSVYISAKTNIIIRCPEHGEYTITPDNFKKSITGSCRGCSCSKSRGEKFVEASLENLGLKKYEDYTPQYQLSGEKLEISNIRNIVLVDYYLELNGIKYIIEVNGSQHYKEIKHFTRNDSNIFYDQIKRDQAVFLYCGINQIIYIEIPYTKLKSEEQVFNILKRILIDKEPVSSVIGDLPKYKFIEKEDQDG